MKITHVLLAFLIATTATLTAESKNLTPEHQGPKIAPDSRIILVIPRFEIIAPNVTPELAEQMKQILISDLQNDNIYSIVVSSSDLKDLKNGPLEGDSQTEKKANYILLGKIITFEEREKGIGFGGYKAKLGKIVHYGFSFEVINTKTNEMVLIKNWDFSVKSGTIGISTPKVNGDTVLAPDIADAYEKNLQPVLKYIEDQKSKIVLN